MNLNQYILPFILGVSLSAVLTPIIRKLSLKWGFFDYPSPRKIHDKPIPRLGGLAIFLSFLLVVSGYLIFSPEKLAFVKEKFLVREPLKGSFPHSSFLTSSATFSAKMRIVAIPSSSFHTSPGSLPKTMFQ